MLRVPIFFLHQLVPVREHCHLENDHTCVGTSSYKMLSLSDLTPSGYVSTNFATNTKFEIFRISVRLELCHSLPADGQTDMKRLITIAAALQMPAKWKDRIFQNLFQYLDLLVIDVKEKHFLTLTCNTTLNFRVACSLKKVAGYNELRLT